MKKKLFIGIPVSSELTQTFQKARQDYDYPFLKWTKPENLHVTACFIGYVPVENLENIFESFHTFSSTSFTLQLNEISPVKRRNRVDMIWATFQESERFNEIYEEFHRLFKIPLHRPPLAHITLCRVKAYEKDKFPMLKFPSVKEELLNVNSIILYESASTGKGADYIPLRTIELV